MNRDKHKILENLIYAIIWLVVIFVPVFSFRESGNIDWSEVRFYWVRILPFFVLFLVNNYLFIPRLLLRKRQWLYLMSVALFIGFLFFLWFILLAKPMMERRVIDFPKTEFVHPDSLVDSYDLPMHMNRKQADGPHRPMAGRDRPVLHIPVRMTPLLNDWIIAFLIVGFNIAIRFMFKSIRDDRQIRELESHSLQSELNYLKTQINPHFFMNTLNNIHALVDIDTEKAKQTVIELSRIMRYVLYEADRQSVPLNKEVEFLENYVGLMRIRFTDQVDIRTVYPDPVPDLKIPPLLLVTLLENAFKHGISYRRDSFIHTTLFVEENMLVYHVSNSTSTVAAGTPGVGMENMSKRLDLLYSDRYFLQINNTGESYDVILKIPLEK